MIKNVKGIFFATMVGFVTAWSSTVLAGNAYITVKIESIGLFQKSEWQLKIKDGFFPPSNMKCDPDYLITIMSSSSGGVIDQSMISTLRDIYKTGKEVTLLIDDSSKYKIGKCSVLGVIEK